jgi:serine/threonine-protein phosphatase 2B catalytic subunit
MDGQSVDQNAYIDSAVRAVQNKKQVPEIDFTLHTMEDGTQVSTQERVCKGMLAIVYLLYDISGLQSPLDMHSKHFI